MKKRESRLDPKHMWEYIRYFSILSWIADRLSKQGYAFKDWKIIPPNNKDK